MPRDRQPKRPDPDRDLLDKVFGAPDEMPDEDLAMLFEALAPDSDDPPSIVHRLAEGAAVEYRKGSRPLPDHVQAALDATREAKNLDDLGSSKLRQMVDEICLPFTGSVNDAAYAYRNRDGKLDAEDQVIIDQLTDEVKGEWDDQDDSKGTK